MYRLSASWSASAHLGHRSVVPARVHEPQVISFKHQRQALEETHVTRFVGGIQRSGGMLRGFVGGHMPTRMLDAAQVAELKETFGRM